MPSPLNFADMTASARTRGTSTSAEPPSTMRAQGRAAGRGAEEVSFMRGRGRPPAASESERGAPEIPRDAEERQADPEQRQRRGLGSAVHRLEGGRVSRGHELLAG